MPKSLNIHQLACRYDKSVLFEDISFALKSGELCALLGPSGCGKTTLLRAIAGLQPISGGRVELGGKDLAPVRVAKRGIGMVFQDYALFPHMTVSANIGFGLTDRKTKTQRIEEMLALVGLEDFAKRYPYQLSGGQQQRVALARALAPRPQLLLLDEPFSSLDSELRQSLCRQVREILNQAGVTAIMVTHDQTEAFTFADNIGLICEGKLQQFGSAHDLYFHPANRLVANFIGQSQFIPAMLEASGRLVSPVGVIQVDNPVTSGPVWLLSRPENWLLGRRGAGSQLIVTEKCFYGAETHYQLAVNGQQDWLTVRDHDDHYAVGERLYIEPRFKQIIYFPRK